MARNGLPLFIRDQQTGSMKEFTQGEATNFALVRDDDAPSHFRVLVADEVETDRLLMIWLLGQAWPDERDVMVECAANGAEALEKIRHNRYELVVLDWDLPHQDGANLLRAIREREQRLPVVVVSGQRREAIANDLESMAAAFVNKDELDPHSFGNAITTSMELQDRVGLVEAGFDTTRV